MTLYLKYRPQVLDELDLKEVRESLMKVVKSGNIPHAFLFSGPKGTGKTSAARILAKIVNCEKRRKNSIEPCNKCSQCKSITNGSNIDIIELDAASHRGIDDVRSLRDAVKLSPAKGEKKVYIIDESHMLTAEASNALLKTLEEPPEHVMFILATTNPEKLIDTIRSRATNILFKKAQEEEVVRSLERVTKGEKIKADKEVLKAIAKSSDGSFRDATKILEQLVAENKSLTLEKVEEYLFQKRSLNIENLIGYLVEKETKKAIEEIENVVSHGSSMKNYLELLLSRLRGALLVKVGMEGEDIEKLEKQNLLYLIKLFSKASSELKDAIIEQIPVEIAIVEWCEDMSSDIDYGDIEEGSDNNGKEGEDLQVSYKKQQPKVHKRQIKVNPNVEITDEVWSKVLSIIKPINTSTEALLRAAKPVQYDGETLTLGVYYSFHKEKLEGEPHRRLLEDVIKEIIGDRVRVVCTLSEAPQKPLQKEPQNVTSSDKPRKGKPDSVLTETDDEDIIKVAKEIFGN